jgi:thioredoxin reductase (NADPH)
MDIPSEKATEPAEHAYDVVVVGGGASGLAAGMFAARYGLDVVIFDRGQSAIRRSYTIENYLGFLGIDPQMFLELGRAHARFEGCEVVDDFVVEVAETAEGFRVETQDGATVETESVVAASAYNADYLTGLDGGEFHDEGDHPVDCDEATGRTTVDGLYVAGWLSGGPHQVLISAGHGARVAKALVRDRRAAGGYWEEVAQYWDWSVEEGTYGDEQWHQHVDEWFEGTLPEDHDYDEDHVEEVREEIKEERLAIQQDEEERRRRIERGRDLLRQHLDS